MTSFNKFFIFDILFRDLTIEEIAALLEELYEEDEDDIVDIFIDPPPCNVDSDEDLNQEDSGGKIGNLSGRHLLSGASAILRSGKRLGGPEEDISEDPKTEVPNRKRRKKFEWKNEDIPARNSMFPESNSTKYRNKDPCQLFELFFDDNLVSLIICEIQKYAFQKNKSDPKVSVKECPEGGTPEGVPPSGPGRFGPLRSSSIDSRVPDDIRLDGYGHFVQLTGKNNVRRRCAGLYCSARVRTECRKCDVGLCIECFPGYHDL